MVPPGVQGGLRPPWKSPAATGPQSPAPSAGPTSLASAAGGVSVRGGWGSSAGGVLVEGVVWGCKGAEGPLTREHQRATAGIQPFELGIRHTPNELDVASGARPQGGQIATTAADDLELDPQPREGVDRQVDALVGNQPRDNQVIVVNPGRRKLKRVAVDRRVDHRRIAAVVLANPG